MDFPAFDHAQWLVRAWSNGAPRHDLGGSAFVPDDPLEGLPRELQPGDVGGLDMGSATAFRDAVADHLGLDSEGVRPTAGTSAANLAVIAAHAGPGSHVVCERPYYAPLPHMATGFGADVEFVEHDGQGLGAVADAIRPRTSLVLLTSPNNPTGRAASHGDLLRVADAAHDHDAVVLVDQVFRELTDHALASGHPALLSTGGLNKCWGAPGLRAGWVAGDPHVLEHIADVHRLLLLAPSAAGTRLGTRLLGLADARRAAFKARTRTNGGIFETWCAQEGLPCGHGELVAFVPAPTLNTSGLAQRLLDEGILTVPGESFGMAGHLRIGLGGPGKALEAGLAALAAAWR